MSIEEDTAQIQIRTQQLLTDIRAFKLDTSVLIEIEREVRQSTDASVDSAD